MRPTTPLLLPLLAWAALTPAPGAKFDEMDYGRFLTASFHDTPQRESNGKEKEGKSTLNGALRIAANKGIAVNLGQKEGAMIFDTDLLRVTGGWTGGWIRLKGVAFDGGHGPNPSAPADANLYFGMKPTMPGWSLSGDFSDPRKPPAGPGAASVPFGPIPKNIAKYRGLYLHGDHVVFAYTVGNAALLEMPGMEKAGDATVLTRTFNIVTPGDGAHVLLATTPDGETATLESDAAVVSERSNGSEPPKAGEPSSAEARVVIGLAGTPPAGARIEVKEGCVSLHLPSLAQGGAFKVVYAKGAPDDLPKLVTATRHAAPPADLTAFTTGGPAHWPETVTTQGKRGQGADPYVLDTIAVPFQNPYKSWLRLGGLDFFNDGRAAVSTWSGDVWVVSGIDENLEKVQWKRYATGLFHALGLKIVGEQIYVLGRDQVTKLHDLNSDGEADLYECFNNDVQVTPGFHEFTFDLQTDPEGNFYFAKGGPVNPGGRGWGPLSEHHGCIFKVSKDGQKFEVFATGLRAPNGIGVGPNGEVTSGDNEGTWVPACYVHLARPGDFISVADLAHRDPPPVEPGKHICYLPKSVDNSGGGQTWVTSDQWGPMKGRLLHLTYGKSGLLGVVFEKVGDLVQGGAFRFPFKFDSGGMRGRFHPRDGQLYVVGLKGWQTDGSQDACFQRVRYTGAKVSYPSELHVTDQGIHLGFYDALDAATAGDVQNYAIEQWNYRWSRDYGSPEFKVSAPAQKGRDPVEVKSVRLSPDRQRVFLEVPGLRPVDQMRIKLNIKGEDGSAVPKEIVNTIHTVASEGTAGQTYSSAK